MRESTYENKHPVYFPKAKLAWWPFATIYYSNVFTFLLIYPLLLQFTYKVDLKTLTPEKATRVHVDVLDKQGAQALGSGSCESA